MIHRHHHQPSADPPAYVAKDDGSIVPMSPSDYDHPEPIISNDSSYEEFNASNNASSSSVAVVPAMDDNYATAVAQSSTGGTMSMSGFKPGYNKALPVKTTKHTEKAHGAFDHGSFPRLSH